MKTVFGFLFIFFSGMLAAQQAGLPVIKSTGKTVHDFVPKGWKIADSVAYGDLNKDKIPDAAFIIQLKDTMTEYLYNEVTKKRDVHETSNPRILIILFKMPAEDNYQLAVQNNDFILRPDEGGVMGDPLQGLEIKRGALTIYFYGGSRERWSTNYVFRFQNNDWFLIGALSSVFDDLTHAGYSNTYNFSTKKEESVSFTGDANDKGTTVWKPIRIDHLRTFKTFIRPLTWEIEKGVYL